MKVQVMWARDWVWNRIGADRNVHPERKFAGQVETLELDAIEREQIDRWRQAGLVLDPQADLDAHIAAADKRGLEAANARLVDKATKASPAAPTAPPGPTSGPTGGT